VLEKNADVNVLVEGHTDNVPFNGSGIIKDNWDLSVKRATSVVKIILEKNNIDAQRLTAAGRADYEPISTNDTKEGRAKNRRTEIILTPKLDELFKLLESN
jgi:chemotaxis protein MotB